MENLGLKPPNALNLHGNVAENWKKWQQQFGIFLKASGADKKDDGIKIAILLNTAGEEAIELFNTFEFETKDGKSDSEVYDCVVAKFTEYANPRKNTLFERYKFWQRHQKEGETIDQFVVELKTMAKNCEYSVLTDQMIRDRVIFGIVDEKVKGQLLKEDVDKLTLERVLAHCRAAEATSIQLKEMTSKDVHALKYRSNAVVKGRPTSRQHIPQKRTFKCRNCGNVHGLNECPAYGKRCLKCGKMNHFQKMCRSTISRKNIHLLESDEEDQDDEYEIDEIYGYEEENCNLFIGSINLDVHAMKMAWFTKIKINNMNEKSVFIDFKLDTGAEANVIPFSVYQEHFEGKQLEQTAVSLSAFGNHKVSVNGKVLLNCEVAGKKKKLLFFVADVASPPILGLRTCVALGLVRRVHIVTEFSPQKQNCQPLSKDTILQKYPDLFKGLGEMPGQYHIKLRSDAVPVIHPPRKVPLGLHDRLKQTLAHMEAKQVIARVDHPTEWVNSLVIVEKKNKDLRLCLDPKNLNEAVMREHYNIPTAEDIANKLSGKKVFSILDQKDSYWQIKLDEASSDLCTFNTPFGRYKFLRCPFGISSAAEVFQKRNEQLFGDIEGCHVIADDMLIAGKDDAEHDHILTTVLERAKKNNIKFNPDKIQLRVSEVKYMGNLISAKGQKVDPSKLSAISDYPQPKTKQELQRFLGMVNYLGQFVTNLSAVSAPLRALLKSDTDWQWQHEQQHAFDSIKSLLTQAPVLQFFDTTKPVVIQCDASKDGLGTCLLQENLPVAYASRSLTSAEKNYSQIEKELLSIVFSCEKFSHYIYGRPTVVHSDHKPLEMITQKDISKASPRLQRMLLRLQKYDLVIKHKPGKEMHIADALSRAFLANVDKADKDFEEDMEAVVHSFVENLPVAQYRLDDIKEATANDSSLQNVMKLVSKGWPHSRKSVPSEARPYWHLRDELHTADGLLFAGRRLIIPAANRRTILDILHESHLGIDKTRSQAREILYWPGISKDIEILVKNCNKCIQFSRSQQKEPLQSHAVPQRAWQKLAADLLEYGGNKYLCIVDYFSKFPILRQCRDITANTVIAHMKSIFSEHGIPEELVSDNMPFDSRQFRDFAQNYGFVVTTSSPTYPQSNGMVERTIGTIKQLLRKCEDPYMALLEYRNSPVTGLKYSPAQLLQSRRLRSKLPVHNSLLKPTLAHNVTNQLKQNQKKQAHYYNRSAKPLPKLRSHTPVYIRDKSCWKPAVIQGQHSAPRSFMVKNELDNVLRRNRKHIKQQGTAKHVPDDTVPYDSILGENEQNTSQSAPEHSPQNPPPHEVLMDIQQTPAADQGPALRRSNRQRRPVQRLIESD